MTVTAISITRAFHELIKMVVKDFDEYHNVSDFFRVSGLEFLDSFGIMDKNVIRSIRERNNSYLANETEVKGLDMRTFRKKKKKKYEGRSKPITVNLPDEMIEAVNYIVKELQMFPWRSTFFVTATILKMKELGYIGMIPEVVNLLQIEEDAPEKTGEETRPRDMRYVTRGKTKEERIRRFEEVVRRIKREMGIA